MRIRPILRTTKIGQFTTRHESLKKMHVIYPRSVKKKNVAENYTLLLELLFNALERRFTDAAITMFHSIL